MKVFYSIQFIDLMFQLVHKKHKKIQVFEEYKGNPASSGLFNIIIRHREKVVWDGFEITEFQFF